MLGKVHLISAFLLLGLPVLPFGVSQRTAPRTTIRNGLRHSAFERGGSRLCSSPGLFAASPPIESDVLCDLLGYTILDCSPVEGDFEGADYGKRVRLDNGMVFEFMEYNYTYSYRPEAVGLAKSFDAETKHKLQEKGIPEKLAKSYKLVVEDEAYDVLRLR
jgi:hypothetical protein